MRGMVFLVLLVLVTLVSSASAVTVIDFEDASPGDLPSDYYLDEGVLIGGPVGAQVWGYDFSNTCTSGDWYSPLEFTFVVPGDASTPGMTNYVALYNWFGPGNGFETDWWIVSAYDWTGDLIETKTLVGDGWLTFEACDIHKVVLDDVDNTAFAMDNLTFNSPTAAPGLPAIALVGAAPALGAVVRGLRRRR